MNKKILVILTSVASVVMGAFIIYLFQGNGKGIEIPKLRPTECLDEKKEVSYKIEEKESPLADAVVFVSDKSTEKESFSFKIENIFKTSTSIELHKCGVYVIRIFNYDPNKTRQNPGYKDEIWAYDYNGRGKLLVLLSEKPKEFISYYSLDFRINPDEKYVVLVKGYLGRDDYALVIKDLNNKEDIFSLFAKEIFKQYPNIVGNFDMREWSKDSRYFWGDIFDGAYVLAYFRIDTQNWIYDIYEAPDGAGGGSPLNINTGYVPIQPGQVWTGDYQLTQDLKEQYRKEGKKSELYLYNIFTNKKIFVEIDDEPLFWFKPTWVSDTELQYELPSGEKKIYKIE